LPKMAFIDRVPIQAPGYYQFQCHACGTWSGASPTYSILLWACCSLSKDLLRWGTEQGRTVTFLCLEPVLLLMEPKFMLLWLFF
jgi:hypothetical protein